MAYEEGNNEEKEMSHKEERMKRITHLYYSRKDVQKAIFNFSSNREVVPRYMTTDTFGKRPDSLQYPADIFELVKRGATSFHCSEELWEDPLKISTDLNSKQLSGLRVGWDLLLDIDSKYLDYSKIMAELIIKTLKFYGVENIGIKFSGSKGFHIIVPWKAFPKTIYDKRTSDMFPEWPRIITKYIMEFTKRELIEKVTELTKQNRYVKDFEASEKVVPDLILVSPRHLFRMPYSLHEKTALSSVVIDPEEIHEFQPKDADPLKVEIRNFLPDSREGEASELLREALDWYKIKNPDEETDSGKEREFKPIILKEISEKNFPPSIKKILLGIPGDGRKRALFILLGFFRSIGMDRKDLEKSLYEWNKKNAVPLKDGYIKTQIIFSYRGKSIPPPNYDKDYYKAVGIIPTEEEMRYKNPTSYMVRKTLQGSGNEKNNNQKKRSSKDNFKNKQ